MLRVTRLAMSAASRHSDILSYWFGASYATTAPVPNFKLWFDGTPEIDADIREKFSTDVEAAIAGKYDEWKDEKYSALALILLLDQFPLNIYRDSPLSFEASRHAIPVTRHMVEKGWDDELAMPMRLFVYLPLEHGECLAEQEESMSLFRKAVETERREGRPVEMAQNLVNFAQEHYDVVKKYGRFPGRNFVFKRESTPEEEEYLKNGGVF